MHPIVNTEQAEAWNGYEGVYWADHQDRWDAVNDGFNDHLFAAAAIGDRDRVLDVGCGNGQTTRLAARRATRGHVVGVALSAPMLERARATAADAGLTNVTCEQGDAQVHPFPSGSFDVAISRFGIMFFADPVAAFANVGRALRPGGRLAFLCFQDMSRNNWLLAPASALGAHVPVPDFARPGAPGMFSLADPARIGEVLAGAGFEAVTSTAVEVPMLFGRDANDAAGFLLNTGPARAILGQVDQTTAGRARDAVTAALRPYEGPGGVRLRGAAWVVRATRPDDIAESGATTQAVEADLAPSGRARRPISSPPSARRSAAMPGGRPRWAFRRLGPSSPSARPVTRRDHIERGFSCTICQATCGRWCSPVRSAFRLPPASCCTAGPSRPGSAGGRPSASPRRPPPCSAAGW